MEAIRSFYHIKEFGKPLRVLPPQPKNHRFHYENGGFSNFLAYFLTIQKGLGEDLGKIWFLTFSTNEKTELFDENDS